MTKTANTAKLKVKKMRFSQPQERYNIIKGRTLDNATYPTVRDNVRISNTRVICCNVCPMIL